MLWDPMCKYKMWSSCFCLPMTSKKRKRVKLSKGIYLASYKDKI